MFYDVHAEATIFGVKHAATVRGIEGNFAWGHMYSNPDRDDEQRVNWEATRKEAGGEWTVVVGGVADVLGSVGDTMLRAALKRYEEKGGDSE